MIKRRLNMILAALTMLAALPQGAAFAAPSNAPANFADPAFQRVWERTDALVDSGKVKRSWLWGPTAGFATMEEYDQGPGGKHLVQYFDKSRMEINNPNGDKSNPFYVTNGLLARELITGRIQVGDDRYIYRYPAAIPLASDSDDPTAPTYESFRDDIACCAEPNRVGEQARNTINKQGHLNIDFESKFFLAYHVTFAYFEKATGRNVPNVFWDFLNSTGPVMVDGKQTTARLSDPYFYATGYPISGAYWMKGKIAGKEDTDVLVQVFERRVLTYVPSLPEGFQVQMGNIGQHYYNWRYGTLGQPPALAGTCSPPPWPRLGTVWTNNTSVRRTLGCPNDKETPVKVVQQTFQNGQMLNIIQATSTGVVKWLYVLYADHSVLKVDDIYIDGMPEPTTTPPISPPKPGLYAPVRGFGKVWYEHAEIRERLGWATNSEVATDAGALMYHEHGVPVYAGAPINRIYLLYAQPDGYGSMFNVQRWETYPAP
jgi:hypothetical protein